MSIFLTRPVINAEEERNAKADILELINFERFCRDNDSGTRCENVFCEKFFCQHLVVSRRWRRICDRIIEKSDIRTA